jgi:hypothetical protein
MNSTSQIEENNLSLAWAKALTSLAEPGVQKLSPLIVTVRDFINEFPREIRPLRQILEEALKQKGEHSVHTTANTIFPLSLWEPSSGRKELYNRYLNIYSEIKRLDTGNRYGTYFHRLVSFGSGRTRPYRPVNQLEHIISTFNSGNSRGSALQASVIDPYVDHTNQRQRGFPCLQQVSFVPETHNKELTVFGYYPLQYVFDRAYGNYLGLCRLGRFMAHEMGLTLSQVTCITGVARLGNLNKTEARSFMEKAQMFFDDTYAEVLDDRISKEVN